MSAVSYMWSRFEYKYIRNTDIIEQRDVSDGGEIKSV